MDKQKWLDKNGIVLGEIYENRYGDLYSVEDYIDSSNVHVIFRQNDLRPRDTECVFKSGQVLRGGPHDSYSKTVRGLYCLGERSSEDEAARSTWRGIVNRCFKGYAQLYDPWRNFSNFLNWFEKQHYESGWHVDKDILTLREQRLYSPETCCVVPAEVNAFVNVGAKHSIAWEASRKRYRVSCGKTGGGVKTVRSSVCFDVACRIYQEYKRGRLDELLRTYPLLDGNVKSSLMKFVEQPIFSENLK